MPSLPLLIEWSPSRVRTFDPATGAWAAGATLAECAPPAGREAIVGVAHRSAFVRTTFVPAGSASAVEGVLAFGMAQELPLPAHEAVFGYRLGESVAGKGRRATVGAVRSESLVRLYAEAQAAGLRVRAVVPVAFGAWLAARARGMRDVAVVGESEGTLTVDVVRDGELAYSRAVPALDPEDEIERTLQMADAPELPVLALAAPDLPAASHEARSALEFLADAVSVDRLLFTLEPPAKREARRRARGRMKAQRALVATAIAIGLAAYGVGARARAAKAGAKPTGNVSAGIARARRDGADAQSRLDRAARANGVLDAAFSPAQTMGDAVRALAAAPAEGAWTTGLSVGRVGPLTVTGFARNGTDVSKTLDALSADPRFREMRLVATNKSVVGETPVVQFTLTGSPVGTLPFDRPMKKEKKAPAKAKRTDR